MLVCYVKEYGDPPSLELCGNHFADGEWQGRSYFISDPWGYAIGSASGSWATNIVALSNGTAYAFWQYRIENATALYYNQYNEAWYPEAECPVYINMPPTHIAMHENACVDSSDNVFVVYSSTKSSESPMNIFLLRNYPGIPEFGDYPGVRVSLNGPDTSAIMPYCTISYTGDEEYLNVIWFTQPRGRIYCRSMRVSDNQWGEIIDTIAAQDEKCSHPSITADYYGNLHVVWQVNYQSTYLTKYRKFDAIYGTWSNTLTIPANLNNVNSYGLPVITCDIFNNLHLLMTGVRVSPPPPDGDEEVYYSFYDAPPFITNLHYDPLYQGHGIKLYWSPRSEKGFTQFDIYHRYSNHPWSLAGSTFGDTSLIDTNMGDSMAWWYGVHFYVKGTESITGQYVYTDTITWYPHPLPPIDSPWGKQIAGNIPNGLVLFPNSPNPFNATTEIRYALPIDCEVKLTIYDIAGRKVRELVDNHQNAGCKSAIWDGRDSYGNSVASGVYIYRLDAAGEVFTKRMLMIK